MLEPIRVLLVDDSVFVLHGLTAMLEASENIVIVGTAKTHAEAIVVARDCQPDVVVLDIRVGVSCGIALCEAIRHTFPSIAVLFLTACRDRDLLRSAIYAGAQGYLLKSCSGVDLVRSVRAVAEGKAVIDPTLIPYVMTWIRERVRLSGQQKIEAYPKVDDEVLFRIAAGKSTKQIAKELHATPNQIASRIQTIYKRLKISSRAEATSWFVRWGEGGVRVQSTGTAVTQGAIARRMMLINREMPLKKIDAQSGGADLHVPRTDQNGRPTKPQQAKKRRVLFSVR